MCLGMVVEEACGGGMIAEDYWNYGKLTACYVTMDFQLNGTKFSPISYH